MTSKDDEIIKYAKEASSWNQEDLKEVKYHNDPTIGYAEKIKPMSEYLEETPEDWEENSNSIIPNGPLYVKSKNNKIIPDGPVYFKEEEMNKADNEQLKEDVDDSDYSDEYLNMYEEEPREWYSFLNPCSSYSMDFLSLYKNVVSSVWRVFTADTDCACCLGTRLLGVVVAMFLIGRHAGRHEKDNQ